MNSTIIKTRLGEIEYVAIGEGIPVVFMHGGHSNCHETLNHKGFDLSKFRLIIPSRPGYGRTPLKGKMSAKETAGLMNELLAYLSIDQAVIYGISAGGLSAIEFAAHYPDRVLKLILASAVSKKWLDEKGKIYQTARLIFNPHVERFTWLMVRSLARFSPNMVAKSFYPQFSSRPMHELNQDDIRELISALSRYNSKNGFLNDIDQSIHHEALRKIACPCLIVHSKNDNSVSFAHALHSNDLIKNTRLIALDNEWGHLIWIGKDAEPTLRKIVEFVSE